MSKLNELIEKLCTCGIEYKKFNEVAKYIRGVSYNKTKEINNGLDGYKLLTANNITLKSNTLNFEKVKVIDYSVNVKKSQMLVKNDILICAGSGSKEHIGKVAFIEKKMDYTFGGFMGVIRTNNIIINPRYMFHIMTSPIFKEHLYKVSNSSTINNINSDTWKDFKIPIPKMEIQCEIVNILDKFSKHSRLLSAELNLRKKQYEFYRDSLLKNDKDETNTTLCNIAEYSKDRISASELNEYNYIGVENLLQNKMGKQKASHIPKDGNLTKYKKNDILIGNIRPYLKKIWFANNTGGTNSDVLVIRITSDKVIPQYLYYILSSDKFFKYDNNNSKGSKMPRGNKDAIMRYNFYLPNIREQKKIINILQKFDKLCSDISEGLPAEIEVRQKQYEYYRDKILTFNIAK